MVRIGAIIRYAVLVLIAFNALIGLTACTPAPVYRGTRTGTASPPATNRHSTGLESAESFRIGQVLVGEASFYGPGFHGKLTANGETYNQNDLTCAHKTLPFNTKLRVTFMPTGKTVVVRVNDRGPYKRGRILDLSVEAARRLGMYEIGTGIVRAQIIALGDM
ncbi:MAG: septal ring lytic transglycosylase RlpA family protein [bacterium]